MQSDYNLILEARTEAEYLKDRWGKYEKYRDLIISLGLKCSNANYNILENKFIDGENAEYYPSNIGLLVKIILDEYPDFLDIYDTNSSEIRDNIKSIALQQDISESSVSRFLPIIFDYARDREATINTKSITTYPDHLSIHQFSNIESNLINRIASLMKLGKNSRIDYMLDWVEFFSILDQSSSSHNILPNFDNPKISGKIQSKIYSKVGNSFDVDVELSFFKQLLEWIGSNSIEIIENILRRDGFQSPFRLPSELTKLIQDRNISTNLKLITAIRNGIRKDESSSDTILNNDTLIIRLMELFNKTDEGFDYSEAFDLINILLFDHPDLKTSAFITGIKNAVDLDDLFTKYFVNLGDVDELCESSPYLWVSEDGKVSNDVFDKQLANCGRDEYATKIITLCTQYPFGETIYLYGHVMAALNDDSNETHLIQSHGVSNSKPTADYHPAFVDLLNQVVSNISDCTAHKPEACFKLGDLSPFLKSKLTSTISEYCFREDDEEDDEDEEIDETDDINSLIRMFNRDDDGTARWDQDDTISYSIDVTLPGFLSEVSLDRQDGDSFSYEIYDGQLSITGSGNIEDYDHGAPSASMTESVLEDFSNILADSDMTDVIDNLISEGDDLPRILSTISNLAYLEGEYKDGYINITPIVHLNEFYVDYMHFNKPLNTASFKDDNPIRDEETGTWNYHTTALDNFESTPPVQDDPPTYQIREILKDIFRDISSNGYIADYFKNKPRVRTIDNQKQFAFESYVSKLLLTESSDEFDMITLELGKDVYRYRGRDSGIMTFKQYIKFPTFPNDATLAEINKMYKPMLRVIDDIAKAKYSEFNEYLEDLINSYDDKLTVNGNRLVVYNTSRPAFVIPSSLVQRSKLRMKKFREI